jgi:hypothetical protein
MGAFYINLLGHETGNVADWLVRSKTEGFRDFMYLSSSLGIVLAFAEAA